MNRFQKAYQYQLEKDKPITTAVAKTPDMISILYDEEFISSINSVSRIIKNFYKTKSILFTNMKQFISNQNIVNIQSTFDAIDKSYGEFYADAKSIFKKMKSIRNENLEKTRAAEANGGRMISSHSNRCNTIGSESIRNPLNKLDVSLGEMKLRYEQMKSENTLLKKKIDVFQSKFSYERSSSQMHCRNKDNFSNTASTNNIHTTLYNNNASNNNKELITFAQSVNKFLQTINKIQSKNISIELDNNLSDLRKYSPLDKQIKQTFTKEKFELSKLCIKHINNLQPNKIVSSLFTSTPTSKKSVSIKSYMKSNQDSTRELKELFNYSQSEITNQSSTHLAVLSKENDQYKNNFNHLNNAHMLEITKNKSLTEQLLKMESEASVLNKEKAMLNDKYLKLIEEKEFIVSSLNSQISQLKKIASASTQGVEAIQKKSNALIEENNEMQTEIDRLNKQLEVLQSNKKELDNQENIKAKKTDSQLNSLGKKNADLSMKIATFTAEHKKLKQELQDKDNEFALLNRRIFELTEMNQKNAIEAEVIKKTLDSEQRKNHALKKENDETNTKMKEILEAFNQRFNNSKTESIEKSNRTMILELKEKNKEIYDLNEALQVKENEIKLEKENIISLINKHTVELNKERDKYTNSIAKIQDHHSKEKAQSEDYIKELKDAIEKKENDYTIQIAELVEAKARSQETISNLIKENKELNSNILDKQDQLKNFLGMIEKTRTDSDNKIQSLTEDNINKQSQINKASSVIESKDNTNVTLKEENENYKKEILDYKSKLTQLNHSIHQLNEIINKQREESESLKLNHSVQINKLLGDIDTKDKELSRFKELYDLNTSNQSILNELINKMNEESTNLKLKDTLKKKKEINKTDNLSKIISNKDEEIKELKTTMRSIDQQLNDLKASESNLTQMIQMKDSELSKLSVLHSDLINELLIIQNNIAQGEELIASLKEDNYNNEGIIDEYKQRVNEKDKEILCLNKQIELLQNDINLINAKIDEKNNAIIALEQDLNNAKEQSKEENNRLTQEIIAKDEQLKGLNEEMSNEKSNNIIDINKLKELIFIKEKEINSMLEKIIALTKETQDLQSLTAAKNDQINDLKKEFNDRHNERNLKEANDRHNERNLKEANDLNEITIAQLNNAVNEQEKEIQRLKEDIRIKEEQIRNQEVIEKSKQTQVDSIMTELNQWKFNYDKLNATLSQTIQSNHSLIELKDKEIETTTNQFIESKNEISKLHQILLDNNAQISKFQNQLSQLNEDYCREKKTNEEAKDNLMKEREEFQLRIQKFNAIILSNDDKLNQALIKIEELNDNIIQLEENKKKYSDNIQQLNIQINDLTDTLRDSHKSIELKVDEIAQYKMKQDTLLIENAKLIKQIEDNDKEISKHQSELENKRQLIEELNDQAMISLKTIKEMKTEIESFRNNGELLNKHNQQVNELNEKLKESLTKDRFDYANQIEDLSKEKEKLMSENHNQNIEINQLKNENSNLIKKSNTIQKEFEIESESNNKLKKENEVLLNENKELKTEKANINEENTKQKDQLSQYAKDNDDQKKEIDQIVKDLRELNKDKTDLNSKIQNHQKEINEIQSKNQSLNEIIDNLSNEIFALRSEIEAQDKLIKEWNKENLSKENIIKEMAQEIQNHLKEIEELKAYSMKEVKDEEISKNKIDELTHTIDTHLKLIEELKEELKERKCECSNQKNQIQTMNDDILNKAEQIEKLEKAAKEDEENTNTEIQELKSRISKATEENTSLNNKLIQEAKEKNELKEECNENKAKIIEIEEQKGKYAKEIKQATQLLFEKLLLNSEDNGITYSLIELIDTIDNENDKEIESQYDPSHYALITNINLSTGLSWSLLQSKDNNKNKGITKDNDNTSNQYNEYKWVISDNININDFEEPIEKFINSDNSKEKAYQEEIQSLQKEQDKLLDKLTKSESDYKILNLQIAKILNQQKSNEQSQEKRLVQTIEELKEDNRNLVHELQYYRSKSTPNNNKIFGVSIINEINNNSNFMDDDSNVEDLLNEMTNKRNTINTKSPINNQQIKSTFERLLGEIPLTVSVKSTISTILKQMHFSNEDINQLLNRFRSGVISLHPSNNNVKLPWNANKS